MTEEINPSELGAFTNNLPNKEGIKKLIKAVEDNASDIANKQDKLTAGDNIAISDQNVISATDTKYTAGDNITISEGNVISASVPAGDWTVRTPNNDWTDLFTYDETNGLTSLKNIKIYNSDYVLLADIPKNTTAIHFYSPFFDIGVNSGNRVTYTYLNIGLTSQTASSVGVKVLTLVYTILNDAVNVALSTTNTTMNKSNFIIYTKE